MTDERPRVDSRSVGVDAGLLEREVLLPPSRSPAIWPCVEIDATSADSLDADLTERRGLERTTIADIAVASDDFTILVAALDAAGLDGVFDGRRQSTVFAPTDDAFEKAFDAWSRSRSGVSARQPTSRRTTA